MVRMVSATFGFGSVALLLAMTGAAAAATESPSYQYSQVAAPDHTASCTNLQVNSMTNTGVLLGTEYCSHYPASRGFIKRGQNVREFAVPQKAADTLPAGISNNARYIVVDAQDNYRGKVTSYLYSAGKFHKLTDPHAGADGTNAQGVNDQREVVGSYYTGRGTAHWRPFVWRNGKFHAFTLHVKGAHNVALVDVNDHGAVAGYYVDGSGRYHGFWQAGSRAHVVNAPGAGRGKRLGTQVYGITDNGTYCGAILQRHGSITHATQTSFIHRASGFTTVSVPSSWGGHDTNAATCNDSGDVAGDYIHNQNGNWAREGFLATP